MFVAAIVVVYSCRLFSRVLIKGRKCGETAMSASLATHCGTEFSFKPNPLSSDETVALTVVERKKKVQRKWPHVVRQLLYVGH